MELETDHALKRRHAPALSSIDREPRTGARRSHDHTNGVFATRSAVSSRREKGVDDTCPDPVLVTANAGDHGLVHTLLRAANQSPTHHEFVSWLDEPSYAPSDRLLVKVGGRIVAHLQVLHRAALFEDVRVNVGAAQDLAVLPEFASLGYDRWLLQAAEQTMRENHAVLSLVRTDRPEPLLAAGWGETDTRGYSSANVGDLLSHLTAHAPLTHRPTRGLRIRLWRHVELDAVRGVYRAAAAERWGALFRSEQYWQWLISRRAHSDLIVAVDGIDAWDDLSTESRIVGYAVTHGPQVLELCCLSEYGRAAPRLLQRACQDAIERDYHTISLHTPPDDPLHELIVTAGGAWRTDERGTGGALMVKLLDPERWIESIDPVLRRRTKAARISRPCEIGFDVASQRYRLVLTRRSSRLVADETAEANVRCTREAFSNLLLGSLSAGAARDSGKLTADDDRMVQRLSAIFPTRLFWQSTFDTLRM